MPDPGSTDLEHLDVVIVGAGLSGIGAAAHLARGLPGKNYAVLEARERIGGTWDLFRYPGIRSDSDMFTMGYRFKPWLGEKALADGDSIREYVEETARESGVDRRIRFGHRVVRAAWSSPDRRWTLTVRTGDDSNGSNGGAGEVTLTCGVLWAATGYYNYDQGHRPELPGLGSFAGPVVHPQHWPEDLDYAGKDVLVVGSGATAVTLVPAMAATARHVTMLQRSPSYVLSLPGRDTTYLRLRRWLPDRTAYAIKRWINSRRAVWFYELSRWRPRLVRRMLRAAARKQLPEGYPVDEHFRPSYDPWDQRLCFVPDGDLFRALREGSASIVTDTIETFTERGVELASGEHLDADVVITATGLDLQLLHGLDLVVDGEPVDPGKHVAYKAMLLDDVPNFVFVFGYTNASWTLKADLVSEYVVRLLRHLDETGRSVFVAPEDRTVTRGPFTDFKPGYILRALDRLPQQGDRAPWQLTMNYGKDIRIFRKDPIEDGTLLMR